VRNVGLLDSASARPRSSVFGEDAYHGLELKAAALLHSICRHHALVDGNQRLAWQATVVFLDITGGPIRMTHDQAFDLVMSVAEGRLDVPDVAAVLTEHTEPRRPVEAE
jgi:death-on-curing protein